MADTVDGVSVVLANQDGTKTYTIPNSPSSADFVMTAGIQTIGGTKSFTNSLTVNANGQNKAQLTLEGSNARWVDFGNVGFGTPTASVATKLLLKDDGTSTVKIGVSTDSRLWLQSGEAGSVDIYRGDSARVARFGSTTEFSGREVIFGAPTSSSVFGGFSTTLSLENETLTTNRTITLPVSDIDDNILVRTLNPGLTSSTNGFANLVVDAYGSISRGGDIESLGIYSISSTSTVTGIVSDTAISSATVIVPTGGKTIPAYWWSVGKVITGKYFGTISKSIGTPNITFTLKLGTSIVVTTGALTTQSAGTSGTLEIDFMITCRTLGDNANFVGHLKIKEYSGTTVLPISESVYTLGEISANTNIDHDVDVYITTTAPGGVTINIEQAIIEYKN